ncbi:unnamed protein product [Vitrella brassicaformis CCMP3155]|uniref:Cytochrome b5 heme-binding domain-containing protein n=2 Tax=Vitrella brassicaformis TaxID=1169539 RepID=A0A0G4FLY4_VITBC|nr:unnamed protein product [Vitrella brassicaformis CCMP3155]|eukprot:CEM14943.1 unnamed protein product [Vitrella brassicaformis CCMP3155]
MNALFSRLSLRDDGGEVRISSQSGQSASFKWSPGASYADFQKEFTEACCELFGTKDREAFSIQAGADNPTLVALRDVFKGKVTAVTLVPSGGKLEDATAATRPTSAPSLAPAPPLPPLHPDKPSGLLAAPPGPGRIKGQSGANAAGGSQIKFIQLMNANKNPNPSVDKSKLTKEEVAKHKKGEDAWTILNGKVYHISPYLDFHPGGRAILMSVAGKDCTSQFNKYHPWVNADALLGKLFLGPVKSSLPKLSEEADEE